VLFLLTDFGHQFCELGPYTTIDMFFSDRVKMLLASMN